MKRGLKQKTLSMLLATSLVVGTTALTGCTSGSSDSNGPIQLTVYSQLANYTGLQTGWMGDLLKEKFNVELNIVPDSDGTFQTKMSDGDLGDIVIWGGRMDQYKQALEAGLLFDLEEDNLINDFAPDIVANMPDALQSNRELTSEITEGKDNKLYGWGASVATSSEDHQQFLYTWDTRWDLYKKMGYPKIKDFDEFIDMLKQMQKLDPKDDSGNKTYALSLWPDWDDAMVMYVKATVSAYYGYDEMSIGLYDTTTGQYHDALEENGPYLEMLRYYNQMFRAGLIDPDSMTQTYQQMSEKVQNGGVLYSLFNYCGSMAFNTKEHLKKGEYLYTVKPEEAKPLVYGMSTLGSNYITTLGVNTKYPEKCLEVLNYFCTPDGYMEMTYGPKGECWDYDEDGNTYFTELGEACNKDLKTKMENHEGTFQDGQMKMAVSSWAIDAQNPNSVEGETYNKDTWKSVKEAVGTKIQKDWQNKTKCKDLNEYFDKGSYVVIPGTSFKLSAKDDDFQTVYKQVTDSIKNQSWVAIYAKNDAQFDAAVAKMKKETAGYGYDRCLKWSQDEAARRKGIEDALTN